MPIASMSLYLADTKATVFKFLVISELPVALIVGFYFKAYNRYLADPVSMQDL